VKESLAFIYLSITKSNCCFMRMFLQLLCIAFSISSLFQSCSKEKEQAIETIFKADKVTINLPSTSSKDSILITTNTKWTLSGVPDWLKVSPLSASSDTKVYIEGQANNQPNSRRTTLTLKNSESDSILITVVQQEATPAIVSDKAILNVLGPGQSDSVLITANVPWTLNFPPGVASWITADKISGDTGTSKIRFTIVGNNNAFPRAATLTINSSVAGIAALPITINQEQPDVTIRVFNPHEAGGRKLVIYGSGFSVIPPLNKVTINGVPANVTAATPTELTVTVPMKAGSGFINITVNTKSATSVREFVYDWSGVLTVIAGSTQGNADGIGTDAKFDHPYGIDIDDAGYIYVADYYNYAIRKIAPDRKVTTLPGRAPYSIQWNPTGPNVWRLPTGVRADNRGNVYVVENDANAVSKIAVDGTITLLAGGSLSGPGYAEGTGTNALFYELNDIEMDGAGNLIVVDSKNHRIRKVSPSGLTSRLAGIGQGYAEGASTNAKFNRPMDLTMDVDGNYLVADLYNSRIRKVTPAGVTSTFAGNGEHYSTGETLTTSVIYHPRTIEADTKGNIYVSTDQGLRWITPEGKIRTIHLPTEMLIFGMTTDKNGDLYISDYNNNRICKVTIQ
jgi:hypothetical protein